MTEEELDKTAAALKRGNADGKRVDRAVSFLKSDPEALAAFFVLADALRDVGDMRRLLGTENEMFQELAVPATKRGADAFKSLTVKVHDKNILIALSDIAMSFANRGRKPEMPKRKIRHKGGAK
jgi:hypothetical protein